MQSAAQFLTGPVIVSVSYEGLGCSEWVTCWLSSSRGLQSMGGPQSQPLQTVLNRPRCFELRILDFSAFIPEND